MQARGWSGLCVPSELPGHGLAVVVVGTLRCAVARACVIGHDQPDVLTFWLLMKTRLLPRFGGRHLLDINNGEPIAGKWVQQPRPRQPRGRVLDLVALQLPGQLS